MVSMINDLKKILPYARPYRRRYLFGLAALAFTSGAQLIIPQILKGGVDALASGKAGPGLLAASAAQLVGVALAVSFSRFGWRYFINGSSRSIEADLRQAFFDHLLRLHPGFFSSNKVGDLMALATNDMNAVRMATGIALVAMVDGIFMSSAILAIMFAQAPGLALYTVLPLPLITAAILVLGSFIGGRFRQVQERFADLSGLLQESFAGIRVIVSFVKEKYFLKKFGRLNDRYQDANMELVRLWGLFFPAVTFLGGLTTVVLLYAGGLALMDGSLSPGTFLAMLSYLELLIWPMLGAGFTVNMLQRGAASMRRISAVLETEPEIASPPGGRREACRGGLELRGLSFAYPGSAEPVLRGLSFRLEAGRSLGVLGRTGSGKSSLLALLARMYDPPAGTVFVDGTDVLEWDLSSLRGAFSFVPQTTFLFSATIKQNIEFGSAEPLSEAETARLTALTTLDRDLGLLPSGFATEIGERGVTLSGGQRQRVALARALASMAPILVLDDSLSAVDAETEHAIIEALSEVRRDRTSLIISHRINVLSRCDQVLVLDRGRLVQSGNHDELMGQEGFYREIAELQAYAGMRS